MGRARLDAWLVVLGLTSLLAWSVLVFDGSESALPTFCYVGMHWAAPLADSYSLALMLNSPAKLAWGCALMVAAMMSPLVVAPLRHVHDRGLASRRARAMLVFIAGYAAVWMIVGFGLQAVALAARLSAPAPLVRFSLVGATAILWQVSPAKQWCLNHCHSRPHLAAFGMAADRDAFDFGVTNGISCAGACWALMLLPLLVGRGHVFGMVAVTLFVFAERLDLPAPLVWRWRGPGKALRIIAAQARIRFALRSLIREASQGT